MRMCSTGGIIMILDEKRVPCATLCTINATLTPMGVTNNIRGQWLATFPKCDISDSQGIRIRYSGI